MLHSFEIKPRALRQLEKIPQLDQKRILSKIEELTKGLAGDIKQLKAGLPKYRLRVGDYRILFDLYNNHISIFRIKHRQDAYR